MRSARSPLLDVLGAGAVRSLCTHDDRNDREQMLALIDALLAMGAPAAGTASAGLAATAPAAARSEGAHVS